MTDPGGSLLTPRLRLEPVGPANASDLWLVHSDDEVWPWYDNHRPSLEQTQQRARYVADSWRFHGVHKWIAYDRLSGEVVGRGGLSRTPVDDDWGQSTSACGTRAKSEAAASSMASKESKTTLRLRCACCSEETGTGVLAELTGSDSPVRVRSGGA